MTIIVFILLSVNAGYCFTVSPERIEISVAPDKSYEQILTVKNTDKAAMDMKLRIEDWRKAVEGRRGRGHLNVPYNWLAISPLEFELKEGEVKEVSLNVNIPPKAKGEFNAMIFVNGKPTEIKEGAIAINTSIGIPIYIMVEGTERFRAEVEDLKILKTSPLEMAVTIKNSGNVHIRPTGTIEIINADLRRSNAGSRRFTVSLNEYNYPILPNSSRTLEIKSNNRLEQGEYLADIKMGFADKKYRKKIELRVR